MGEGWSLAEDIRNAGGEIASVHAVHRLFHHPSSPARRGRKKGGPDHAIGRSRGGLSTKIHAVVDQDGLPVRLLISPGQASDMGAVPQLLEGLSVPVAVVADRGYDSNAVLDLIARSGARPNIPSCSRRIIRRSVDPAINRQRNLIERFFCKLEQFRRIATRFDKLARNFLAAVLIASTRIWLKTYESTP
jgi:transposase